MSRQPTSLKTSFLPFRTASGTSGRVALLDRMMRRPIVAQVPEPRGARLEENDALLSGMTRSLHRRLTGLNLPVVSPLTTSRKVA